MAELFERWKKLRDEKNETNRELGDLDPNKPLSEIEALRETWLVRRYNDLYAAMYALEEEFTEDDWQAYEADQADIREMDRQAWLIANRYGDPRPPHGIADWWMG